MDYRKRCAELTITRNIIKHKHGQTHRHPPSCLHVNRGEQKHEYKHASSQQRRKGPLVAIVDVPAMRPCRNLVVQQIPPCVHEADARSGTRGAEPPTFGDLGDLETSQLTDEPYNERRNARREQEAWNSTEGGFGDRREGRGWVAGASLPDGFQRAHITCMIPPSAHAHLPLVREGRR